MGKRKKNIFGRYGKGRRKQRCKTVTSSNQQELNSSKTKYETNFILPPSTNNPKLERLNLLKKVCDELFAFLITLKYVKKTFQGITKSFKSCLVLKVKNQSFSIF